MRKRNAFGLAQRCARDTLDHVRKVLFSLALVAALSCPLVGWADYVSPYQITLDANIDAWTSDFTNRRTAITDNATPPPADWTSGTPDWQNTYLWGPLNPLLLSGSSADPVLLPKIEADRGKPVYNTPINSVPTGVNASSFWEQRLMKAASDMIGTHYQHLHLPDFNPADAPGFTWDKVSSNPTLQSTQELNGGPTSPTTYSNPYVADYGFAQPGIDCTNFTAYLYNLALGIQMNGATCTQIELHGGVGDPSASANVMGADGQELETNFFFSPNYGTLDVNTDLDAIIDQLQPGDILYMRSTAPGDELTVVHGIMWLGEYGTNEDGTPSDVPLIISSHDNTPAVFDIGDASELDAYGYPLDGDIEGHLPPPGVQILPFTPDNWFYQNFVAAMRVTPIPEPSSASLALGGLLAFLVRRRANK